MDLHDIFDDDLEDVLDDDAINQIWANKKIVEKVKEEVLEEVREVDEKVDSTISTWERLLENEGFRELSEGDQKLIWELIKIRENDSPKNQTMVAEQYGVTDAYLSQKKQDIDKLGL